MKYIKTFETLLDLDDSYFDNVINIAMNSLRRNGVIDNDSEQLNKILNSDFDFFKNPSVCENIIRKSNDYLSFQKNKDFLIGVINKLNIHFLKNTYTFLDTLLAMGTPNREIIELLIKRGVDVNNITTGGIDMYNRVGQPKYIKNYSCPTILRFAFGNMIKSNFSDLNFDLSIIKQLINGGADLTIKDSEGFDFLDYTNNEKMFIFKGDRSIKIATKKLKEIIKEEDPEAYEIMELREVSNKYNL